MDVKRKQNLATPSTIKDLQAVLDNQTVNISTPFYTEFLADNYYLTEATWNTISTEYRFSYVWQKNAVVFLSNWSEPYTAVYNANFILDNLSVVKIESAVDKTEAAQIKGAALFLRSFFFHQLSQLFCKPWSSTAVADPGIVLRLTSAVGVPSSQRASVQDTYHRIIDDLKLSVELLPDAQRFKTLPSKSAALGLLSRVYLSMGDYENALEYANKAIMKSPALLDYNSVSNNKLPGFSSNVEVLWMSFKHDFLLDPPYLNIDSGLYKSYDDNDWRKLLFFSTSNNILGWAGSYIPDDNPSNIFNGIATDEIYLNRAECYAKLGNKEAAMSDLNWLLKNRYKTGNFNERIASSVSDALRIIREERRKELAFRGIRWSDLRRFNQEGAAITLKRKFENTFYTLPPNDLRWVLLIPQEEIQQSGITQNPR